MVQEKLIPKVECIWPRTKGVLKGSLEIYLGIVTTEEKWAREKLQMMSYAKVAPERFKIQEEKVRRLEEDHAFLSKLKGEVAELPECYEEYWENNEEDIV